MTDQDGKADERVWTQDEIDADQGLDSIEVGEDFEADCHLDWRDGLCGAAGSEWCDFECPFREEAGRIRAKFAQPKP